MSCASPEPDADWRARFGALGRLYGEAALPVLASMHVCVVGLGGVGSWAVEALARTGVGALTLVDYDTVEPGNCNRQLPALTANFGRKKHAVLAERIAAIHPGCRVTCIDDFATPRNVAELITPAAGLDCVIDAIDGIAAKAALIARCRRLKIPVVTTGGAGGLTDPTQVQVRDLSRTWNDPLAAKVRAKLRADYGFSRNPRRRFGVECVFSIEQPRYPRPDGSVGPEKPGIHGVSLDCRLGYGSAAHVTAVFGMVAAARAVHRTLERRLRA
ncbi:tRNA cyclic N6-threonylcarbamoyladenosine(37) synthase TcdA [Inmirania thermothiophila]|uniref:tRNA A37 threonylcarbamoyladenosine dehydratase n=1 Tax=Inmirania thermothiophila TaxID=1750597 RepID=A0A3N1Y6I2_9GAMM|nr:tRNA cyclic N6-threonylcarbamoyladenosine(37) synthase TcdA [Inmirania thermothiophila]ROR34429.1 tRNA A37 threonylcarbamoyladenosine dehydratase [Inmirania thermothiophila]